MVSMTDQPTQTRALARIRQAQNRLGRATAAQADARESVHAAIRDALRTGVRQTDLVQATGYTREHIRRIGNGGTS